MTGAVRLADDEFARLCVLLHAAAGLVFESTRRESLAYSVAERLRATGTADVAAYLALVEPAGSAERQELLDEVTIQETHFFRNPPQMQALRTQVLPELLRAAEDRGRRLRVWSAGCSTGEEPYTIAMMLRELLPSPAGWDVQVLATDLSEHALAAARAATYAGRALQHAGADDLARHFVREPGGRWSVRPEVRSMVRFQRANLVHDLPPADDLDLVLCRNVTIYFDRPTTRALVQRVHGALRDGGYLLLGHSETLWQVSEDFELACFDTGTSSAFAYRRVDRRAETAVARTPAATTGAPPDRPVRPAPAPRPTGRPQPSGDALDAVRAALAGGRYAEAARLARLAGDVEPLRAEVHYLHGLALVDLGRDEEALPPLRRAVYLEPDAGLAHFLLAAALERTGDRAAAAREYRAAAQTLGRRPGDRTAPELGGRSVRELATLCAELDGRLSAGGGS